ncbi:hypothetical protein J4573_31345 [Actinomadura barringtoniae]|uniref:DNA methylase N-4/N-6 domain-containing protein n=1 Tax=Actinomadura barringtoniae TaxID=1427535 RepID=A0A939PG48_9ACTN|nr:DNA methyltransferase [Actinomadura barringtoniae]MBO2451622.1 hypothetical protein [Actinomadura barringtoniae]
MNNTPSNPEASGAGQPGADNKIRRLLPLTVWLCSDTETGHRQDTATDQTGAPTELNTNSKNRAATKADLCAHHRGAVGRELARHLISSCTREGDVVAEAFTSSDATLVAAASAGRRGVALVPHFPLAQHIGTRLRAALTKDQLATVAMRPCRPDQMNRGLADQAGRVGLIVAAPPPYEVSGRVPKLAGSRTCPACRADLRMLTEQQLGAFLVSAWQVLRPGGHLAVITTARHEGNRLVDPAPRIVRQASLLGFRYVQHVIALRVPIEGDALVVQASPTEIAELRDTQSQALPPAVSVHADVCLFTKPRRTQPKGGEAR